MSQILNYLYQLFFSLYRKTIIRIIKKKKKEKEEITIEYIDLTINS